MKRIFLFVVTNLTLMVVLSLVCSILGIDPATTGGLAIFSLVFGMGGAFVSLLLSKKMAKWSVGARTISGSEGETEGWLVRTVEQLAQQAKIGMPEVAIYNGAANAFATGAFKNKSLVAVSTGLLQGMSRAEVRAVLGHEVAHVANGDMVTMTLLQGVLNAAVLFLSRVIGFAVDRAVFRTRRGVGLGYYLTRMAMQLILGILASMIVMAYSRRREYAADACSARYLGSATDMVAALQRLGGISAGELPDSMKAFGISGREHWARLFSSHPPIESRIARLRSRSYQEP
ncbi:MAG: protease HtpX [Lentisphaerae bacterium]|jgi:heat shock protein HtpX|nr:protease HtpX [Lentisphaerota bacterium]